MFLLAYVDFHRDGRRGITGCTARSLRRVGADVVVLLHCPATGAKRLRRDARYENLATGRIATSDGGVDVAVLANPQVSVRPGSSGSELMCELNIDGRDTAVTAIGEPPVGLYRLLLRFEHGRPVVLVGPIAANLDEPETIEAIQSAGFVDTHTTKPGIDRQRPARPYGILVSGLRNYGDGHYTDPDGCGVHWARLGH